MSQTPLRLAVLGLGKAGQVHAASAMEIGETDLVAVADASEEARARFDPPKACRVANDLDGLLACEPDAIVIALPHGLLADAAVRAAAAGCHLLLEKPMANDLETARGVARAAEQAGVRLMVNYNHRFREEYLVAKRWLDEGRIGQPRLFVDHWYAPGAPLPDWVWNPAVAGGGLMTYSGTHMIDRLLWLSQGSIESLTATTATHHYPGAMEDTCLATLRFADGSLGSLVQTKSSVPHRLARWESTIQGTEGAIRVTSGKRAELSSTRGDEMYQPTSDGSETRFRRALEEFAGAVREGRAPKPDAESGLRVLSCLEAIYRAANEGGSQPVDK